MKRAIVSDTDITKKEPFAGNDIKKQHGKLLDIVCDLDAVAIRDVTTAEHDYTINKCVIIIIQ